MSGTWSPNFSREVAPLSWLLMWPCSCRMLDFSHAILQILHINFLKVPQSQRQTHNPNPILFFHHLTQVPEWIHVQGGWLRVGSRAAPGLKLWIKLLCVKLISNGNRQRPSLEKQKALSTKGTGWGRFSIPSKSKPRFSTSQGQTLKNSLVSTVSFSPRPGARVPSLNYDKI